MSESLHAMMSHHCSDQVSHVELQHHGEPNDGSRSCDHEQVHVTMGRSL
jgi:hypothetical protein